MTTIGDGCHVWQKVITTNDRNGNPRRIIMIYTLRVGAYATSRVVWIDVAYEGVPAWLQPEWELEPIEVTPTEQRRLKRRGIEIGRTATDYLNAIR